MKRAFFSSLTIFILLFTAVFALSAFDDPDDQADDNGAAGTCYIQTFTDCGDGIGVASTCTFTGVYGAPYSCTNSGCGLLGVILAKTRKCVKRVAP